ncbi:MAG: hypothetical protein IKQ30_14990 [Bacteroidales bacterium]|nr:hypothetical protein [Bacteroidales bacterium]
MLADPFERIDAMGSVNKNEPFMRDIEAEMVRSHALCRTIPSSAAILPN